MDKESIAISEKITDNEKIVRVIFSPYHLNKKKTRLKANAFRSPYNVDEVSVTRLNFTNPTFCKKQGLKMTNENKKYFGLGVLNAIEIHEAKAFIKSSPIIPDNPFHADIYYGYIQKKGEPLPPEINSIIKELTDRARYYPDPDTKVEKWVGEPLE